MIVILVGLVRIKIIALLLGPAGIGLIGVFQSIIDMIRSGSLLGMDTVGIKGIAEANARRDNGLFERVVSILNKWFFFLALLGAVVCLVFCYPISLLVFESGE